MHLLLFTRTVVGLVFSLSSTAKFFDISTFEDSLTQFNINKKSIRRLTTLSIILAELVVVGLMVAGGSALKAGFTLAVVLLCVFSTALVYLLVRGISTPCNCFGASRINVSYFDLIRNAIFVLCSLAGIQSADAARVGAGNLLENGLGVVSAVGLVVLSVNFSQFAQLTQKSRDIK